MVRAVIIGLGSMGTLTLKYFTERGGKIVGVFNRSTNVGKDAGEVAGVGNIGVAISPSSQIENLLPKMNPDICLLTSKSLMKDMEEIITSCVSLGFNIYCLGEEAYFPRPIVPDMIERLDKLAKANKCTISGGGVYDATWSHVVTALTACAHNMKEINIDCVCNMAHFYQGTPGFGAELSKSSLGLGSTLEEFTKMFPAYDSKEAYNEPSGIAGGVTSWLASYLDYTITSSKQYYEPMTSSRDIYFKTYKSDIKTGLVTGCREVTIRETKEGIRLVLTFALKAMEENEKDTNVVRIVAEPDVVMSIYPGNVAEMSAVNMVNRIPDMIKAEPGYVTTDRLPPPRYPLSFSS